MQPTLPNDGILALIPAAFARRHRLVPLAASDRFVELGVDEALSSSVLQDASFYCGREVRPVRVAVDDLALLISACYPGDDGPPSGMERSGSAAHGRDLPDWEVSAVVPFVDRLIADAIGAAASDVHVEPYETFLRIRYRLDGVLHAAAELSLVQKDEIVARIKIMAGLDVAERRRPQDGRIRVQHERRTVDLRVSTLPTDFGEKVVLRILDKSGLALDLERIGFGNRDLDLFRRMIRLPYGMILVTGPTGSGKTTTLYAALNAINTSEINITTIEDPIEYNLPGINQTHVRADLGFTFAQALRAFLRQDPNVIMVGEIRDAETAEIAIRAALTGHLVLSTLHTNDAPSSITRLLDMGVEPFLVASSIRLVVAQRLLRRICDKCKTETTLEGALISELGFAEAPPRIFRGAGCDRCNGTGYRGRLAVFETMAVTETLSEMIASRAGTHALRTRAAAEGMLTLRQAAARKLMAGLTTCEEVLRETSS